MRGKRAPGTLEEAGCVASSDGFGSACLEFGCVDCAAAIDVFAYHNYPDYGHNLNPEALGPENDTNQSSKPLREMVRSYPGIHKDLVFWDDEFNDGIPTWTNSDESVQAKYIPRSLLLDKAAGVRTFVWLIVGATDGNEFDDFGMLHGLRFKPDDFTPRPAFTALQNTNTLFSDTVRDPSIKIQAESHAQLMSFAFRSTRGNTIIAYWLPILSQPGGQSPSQTIALKITNSGIRNPVLVDITSGKMTPLTWRAGTDDTLDQLPLRDSVMAIADETYFNWPELPEAPSDLNANISGASVHLTWKTHGGHPDTITLERRTGSQGKWESIAKLSANATSTSDKQTFKNEKAISYRIRASNSAGASAYSNVVTLPQ